MAGRTAGTTRSAQAKRSTAPDRKRIPELVESAATTGAAEKPLRPAQCRTYMRKVLAREFRGIVDGFVEGAKSGSCQHVKLATELLGSPQKRKTAQSGKAVLSKWLEEMDSAE